MVHQQDIDIQKTIYSSTNHVFTCGERNVCLQRNIYDFSQSLFFIETSSAHEVEKIKEEKEEDDTNIKVEDGENNGHGPQYNTKEDGNSKRSCSSSTSKSSSRSSNRSGPQFGIQEGCNNKRGGNLYSLRKIQFLECQGSYCKDQLQHQPGQLHEHLSLRTEFFFDGEDESCRNSNSTHSSSSSSTNSISFSRHRLICRVDDIFIDLEESSLQPSSSQQSLFPFRRRVLQGFLFQSIGMYLMFPSSERGTEEMTLRSRSKATVTSYLRSGQFQCSMTECKDKDGIEFYITLSSHSSSSLSKARESTSTLSLCYKLELLQKDNSNIVQKSQQSTSIVPINTRATTSNRSQEDEERYYDSIQDLQQEDQEIEDDCDEDDEDDPDATHSQASTICFDQRLNAQTPPRSSLRTRAMNEMSASNSMLNLNTKRKRSELSSPSKNSCSKISASQALQPKKNVVKNFVKAFRNYVNVSGDPATLMKCLKVQTPAGLKDFRVAYKKHENAHKFNNTFIKSLLTTDPFKPVFHRFVHNEAWEWLENSSVNNKESHKIVLKDYIKATQDLSQIEQIYSLRSRNRYSGTKHFKHE